MLALRCKTYGSVEDVRVEDCKEPAAPNANEVTIRIDHASVSHAIGLMI